LIGNGRSDDEEEECDSGSNCSLLLIVETRCCQTISGGGKLDDDGTSTARTLSPLIVSQSAEMEMLTKAKSAMVENSVPATNTTININPLLPLLIATEESMKMKSAMAAWTI